MKLFLIFIFYLHFATAKTVQPAQDKLTPLVESLKTEDEPSSLVIGSKIFTENMLLAEILALLLEEKYNFKVIRKFGLGGSKLAFDALRNKQIDVYPEYTGTGYTMILNQSGETNPKKTYKIVQREFSKRFALFWSLPLGFENTYTLAVSAEDLRFKNFNRISQLKAFAPSYRLAVGHEFTERKDGLDSFSKKYQLNFSKSAIFAMNSGLMYSALKEKKVDMIMGYSTDGRIKAFNLKTLKDDKNFFPAYSATYLTRDGLIKNQTKLKKAFQELEGNISEEEMITLNYQVDQLKNEIPFVARKFLIKKSILNDSIQSLENQSLVAYYLSKRKYFFKVFKEHLILTFASLFLALLFSLPVGVLAVYNSTVEKVVFTVVNTLQTVPSLALLAILIPFLGVGFWPALTALFIYSLLPLIRNTFEGLKNVDGSFVEASAGIGLNRWQTLKFVQIPLALPVILAGLRISAVIVVGTATLAAFIGAGGLGDPIFRGIATLNSRLIFLGAVPACLLAIIMDKLLAVLESFTISKGLRLEKNQKDIKFK